MKPSRVTCNLYYQNVRSLRRKSESVYQNMSLGEFEIVCFTETWLSKDFESCEFFPDTYSVYRCDRDYEVVGGERGGGCLVAIRSDIDSTQLNLSSLISRFPLLDIVGCKILGRKNNELFLYCLYVPPHFCNQDFEDFLELFGQLLTDQCRIVIVGDFNVTRFSEPDSRDVGVDM